MSSRGLASLLLLLCLLPGSHGQRKSGTKNLLNALIDMVNEMQNSLAYLSTDMKQILEKDDAIQTCACQDAIDELKALLTTHSDTLTNITIPETTENCPDGTFGFNCRMTCACANNDVCNKNNGQCPNSCPTGFWGDHCLLSDDHYYNDINHYFGNKDITKNGVECNNWLANDRGKYYYKESKYFYDGKVPVNQCRSTKDEQGETVSGSEPWCYQVTGHRWDRCDLTAGDCPAGTFGTNCANVCNCKDKCEVCDGVSGACTSGCAAGWAETGGCQTKIGEE